MGRPSDLHAKIDLLRAAEVVFVQHGLEKARVEEITERAGRSKGSFYLHFESKEDAFRQLVESFLAKLFSLVDSAESDEDADFERIVAIWREKDQEIFSFLWQNRGVARLLLSGGGSARFGYLIDEFGERVQEKTRALLERGMALGYYRADLDVPVASLVISGAYDRVAREVVGSEKKPDLVTLMQAVQTTLQLGLANEEFRPVADPRVNSEERPPASTTPPRPRRSGRTPLRG
jgi:AcrR family transcriptional regulator